MIDFLDETCQLVAVAFRLVDEFAQEKVLFEKLLLAMNWLRGV